MTFLNEIKPLLEEEHPNWEVTEVVKERGKRWKALSDKEKTKFKEQVGKPKEK
jgi:hypothetical protein